jgi:iron(III) transport system ATP-binding protein
MVFQDYALFPHLTVAQNVAYGLPGAKRKGRVEDVLDLAHLEGLGGRMPHELSGGQQQRVALARALAPGPEVVLLDEPFSNLDAALRVRVRAEMRDILADAGATAIFVTHDQEEALSLADEVAVMMDGTVAQKAAPEVLYHNPASRRSPSSSARRTLSRAPTRTAA